MEEWEQRRVADRGDTCSFWALMPDFESYFEELRAIAGEPKEGTTARVLPKYDPSWEKTYWEFINFRIEHWKRNAEKALSSRIEAP